MLEAVVSIVSHKGRVFEREWTSGMGIKQPTLVTLVDADRARTERMVLDFTLPDMRK